MKRYLGACVLLAACAVDPSTDPASETEQTATAEAAVTSSTGGATPNAIGTFHLMRVANTQLCLQPRGGSTGDVIIELRQCNASAPAQNWLIVPKAPSEFEIVNQQSGKCLYSNAPLPLFDGGQPITHENCNISGTSNPASNALWSPSSLTGLTRLMSRVQHRNTGFCLDVPGGNPFDGATLWMWHCNGTPAQSFVVGVE
jgi:Ricin-type beta-trefoil lectin domain-like